ncbi:MAG: DUF1552 domain-containing protein [Planctomycetes bacterium]|nr:DUF1552 domain-containing protein [Planctomycetota bacterium]
MNFNSLDRRRFLRGTGVALALPLFECVASSWLQASEDPGPVRRLACIYFPDGVGMPLPQDPAYQDWAWFPHGNGTEFTFSKCGEPFEPLRNELTILSGFSHPSSRKVHGHCNADQFLTAAATATSGPYQNSISLDQAYAAFVGNQTRFSSIVMSTDGGTGTPRGAQTISFDHNGRAIPAENRPKRVFDMLFVSSDQDAARRLALSKSALDDLLEDAASLRKKLNSSDQRSLDEYLESVREAERRVEKARHWINTPLPVVKADHLKLDITPDEPRAYVQTMFELMYLAFKTDSTRVATYQIGRENGFGISDHLAKAVGFSLAHSLTHETKNPKGWERLGIYCRFLNEEFARFATRLQQTPEPAGQGSMLDNSLLLYGSASSAFHLSRNYPLVLAGGKNMGLRHGQYINAAGANPQAGAWDGGTEPWQLEATREDRPLSNVFATMLKQLQVPIEKFADSDGLVKELLIERV